MKNLLILAILILGLVFVQFAQGQTVDDIINKHIEAMGGRQKIMSLNSAVMTGTFLTQGQLINTVTTKKHLTGSRIEINLEGNINYQLITPKGGWIYTPIQGDKEPRPLVDDQVKAGQLQLDMHGPFLDYAAKGNKVELAGKDTVNALDCYKLKVTASNGNVTFYYIDSTSNLIVKTSTKMFQFGALEDFDTYYRDYRKNEDGYWFAYEFENQRGITRYEKIETNVKVDDSIFMNK